MTPVAKDTVSMYFALAALNKLNPAAQVRALAQAEIPAALLSAPNARLPAPAFSALWLAVARELDDEFFGLDRRAMKVGSFALLCQAAISCETLERALKRTLRGFSLFLDDVQGELRIEGHEAVLSVVNRMTSLADRRFADETYLILVHGLMCWLAGHRIEPNRVDFGYQRPPHVREYTLMYSQHLGFDAERTSMRFDAKVLAGPVTQTTASLQRFLRTAPQSVFLKYRNEDSWTARLRRRLRTCVGTSAWPGFDEIAAEYVTAPTTLRRHLEVEGICYQEIKDQLRSDLAISRLCNSTLSVEEIGAELGFHDASAFHRAFKRWNGLQPGEYRKRRLGASNDGA